MRRCYNVSTITSIKNLTGVVKFRDTIYFHFGLGVTEKLDTEDTKALFTKPDEFLMSSLLDFEDDDDD